MAIRRGNPWLAIVSFLLSLDLFSTIWSSPPLLSRLVGRYETPSARHDRAVDSGWKFDVEIDGDNYGLTEQQCSKTFSKLFTEIEKSVARHKGNLIQEEHFRTRTWMKGMMQGMIYNGELFIISPQQNFEDFLSRGRATLHSLHRALIATPDRRKLPNIEFLFAAHDFTVGSGPIWAYTKQEHEDDVWIMPDFGYWSWPEMKIGPYNEIRRRVLAKDTEVAFEEKRRTLAWRGTLGANGDRYELFNKTRGKPWADVRALDWFVKDGDDVYNRLSMEDHCTHMFLAQVEGRSWSGRGKYLHNCRSVIMTYSPNWIEAHHAALVASGPEQNYVRVQNDWSDLESSVQRLLDDPIEAKMIADNNVATFRDRYLTPAAEACYWRELIRAWASVSFSPQLYEDSNSTKMRGIPFEDFVLKRR